MSYSRLTGMTCALDPEVLIAYRSMCLEIVSQAIRECDVEWFFDRPPRGRVYRLTVGECAVWCGLDVRAMRENILLAIHRVSGDRRFTPDRDTLVRWAAKKVAYFRGAGKDPGERPKTELEEWKRRNKIQYRKRKAAKEAADAGLP